jgi:hypothetical protein
MSSGTWAAARRCVLGPERTHRKGAKTRRRGWLGPACFFSAARQSIPSDRPHVQRELVCRWTISTKPLFCRMTLCHAEAPRRGGSIRFARHAPTSKQSYAYRGSPADSPATPRRAAGSAAIARETGRFSGSRYTMSKIACLPSRRRPTIETKKEHINFYRNTWSGFNRRPGLPGTTST